MNNEMKIMEANHILKKYNMELRYSQYNFNEPKIAELVVKDNHKMFKIGLIKITGDSVIKFYIGNLHFFNSDNIEESENARKMIETLYKDMDALNTLELPYRQ